MTITINEVNYEYIIKNGGIVINNIIGIIGINPKLNIPSHIEGRKVIEVNGLYILKKVELILEEGLEQIYLNYFKMGFSKIYIPKSLVDINISPTCLTNEIEEIIVHKDNPHFDCRDNCNCLISTKDNAIILGTPTSFIPESIEEIGSYAFKDCIFSNPLEIPNCIRKIGMGAFKKSSLNNSIELPNITELESNVFYECTGVKSLKLDNIKTLKYHCLANCKIKTLSLGTTLETIESFAFEKCTLLKELYLPNSIKSIKRGAFSNSSIKTIYCNKKVGELVSSSLIKENIDIIIDETNEKLIPKVGFDLEKDLKYRKNLFAYNKHIDLILTYGSSYLGWYSYASYYDHVYGTLKYDTPFINAASFNEEIITLNNDETLFTIDDLNNRFCKEDDFLTMMSTNVFKYLKYSYDQNKDIYFITGINNIKKIGYLALGYGKEKLVIKSNAFNEIKIVKLQLGPNVLIIEKHAFPSLNKAIVKICEGVDFIDEEAFYGSVIEINYGGILIPSNWSKQWDKKSVRTYHGVKLNVDDLKLSKTICEEKINNYDYYKNVTWEGDSDNQSKVFESCKYDKKKLIAFIKYNRNYVKYIPNEFKNDEDIFEEAIWYPNSSNFKYANKELKSNKKFISRIICSNFWNYDILKYADEALLNDEEFMYSLIEKHYECYEYLGDKLKRNVEFWKKIILIDEECIEKAPSFIKKDKDMALLTVKENGYKLQYFSPEIKKDKEVALEAIKSNGTALQFINKTLGFSNDVEMVKLAISSNVYAYRYASKSLQANEEIALFAINNYWGIIYDIDRKLLKNDEFILKAISVVRNEHKEEALDEFMKMLTIEQANNIEFIKKLTKIAKNKNGI